MPAEQNPEIAGFIQDAAIARGINPWIACAVASTEGGLLIWNAHGHFDTGDSYWPFQLHYGGGQYPGTTPGMGNGFSALTGWEPGELAAGPDSVRYALNRAKRSGWGAWYGAASIGLVGMEGISNSPWDANSEVWDYEQGNAPTAPPPGAGVQYDADYPAIAQNDPWSCGPTSMRWSLWSVGRKPSEQWIESACIEENVANPQVGVTDASGAGIASFLREQYGEFGYNSSNTYPASFNAVANEAGHYPLMIGGANWYHWSGVRASVNGLLYLANPAEGWMGIGQTMTPDQFNNLGPFALVRLTHPDLTGG